MVEGVEDCVEGFNAQTLVAQGFARFLSGVEGVEGDLQPSTSVKTQQNQRLKVEGR
ncbi:hypothetical protein [Mesorhizobium sp. 8]|uniref:hypothetical protein n=1 Tax=Mesorhizobium sp. 8 TaxID=2584466 RepID=UPI0015D66362|nr:hypothetical protein [Mesorhizobium sp. 8]